MANGRQVDHSVSEMEIAMLQGKTSGIEMNGPRSRLTTLELLMKVVPSDLVGMDHVKDGVVEEEEEDSGTTEMVVANQSTTDTRVRIVLVSNPWRRRKVLDPLIGAHLRTNLLDKMQMTNPLSVIEAVMKLPQNNPNRRE